MTKSTITLRAGVEQVLTGKPKGMTVAEIAEAAVPLTGLRGRTPKQTCYGFLYGENKKADGLVTRMEAGRFKLNPKRKKAAAAKPSATKEAGAKSSSRRPRTRKAAASETEQA